MWWLGTCEQPSEQHGECVSCYKDRTTWPTMSVDAPPHLRVQFNSGDRKIQKAFRKLCETASGVDLAPVVEGSNGFASLACSHTICGLRSIASGCESEKEELGDGSNDNPAPGTP